MENIEIVKFGLRLKGKRELLTYSSEYVDEPYASVSTVYRLCEFGNDPWLVETEDQAKFVRVTNTASYNASYDIPCNPYNPFELEVVKVIQIVENEEDDKLVAVKFSGDLEEGERFFFLKENGKTNRERALEQKSLRKMILFVEPTKNPDLYCVINDKGNQLSMLMFSSGKLYVRKADFTILSDEEIDELL